MIYDKNSIDYKVNIWSLHEMEEIVPMTLYERKYLRKWVRSGHEIDSNPWGYFDSDGMPLNYLQAYRLKYGYSSGPWDCWTGPENQILWCDDLKCFLPKDEL
jgi:hypothetical protein